MQHESVCNKAMLDELQRWLNLGAFERVSKNNATHVIDGRWVLKWKNVREQWCIQARLVARGLKDLQATELSTIAGATPRWEQRMVHSIAVQKDWKLFSADVSQAFL